MALVFCAVVIFIAYLAIAIQFVVAMVESYLVIGAGVIFLGFGGSRWTAAYVERYIAYAVSVGMKILVLYLLGGSRDDALSGLDRGRTKCCYVDLTQLELDSTWLPLR